MKSTSLLALALCAGLPAMAQATISVGDSTLTLYGILDAGVGNVAHSLNFDSNFPAAADPRATKFADKSATGMFSGGISGSRLGIRGSADLGAGWKAILTLESSLVITTGALSNAAIGLATNKATGPNMSADSALGGQLFSRAAFVGVSSEKFGSLTLGRNTSFMLENVGGYDPVQAAQLFSPLGFAGSFAGGGATDNTRVDSSIKYKNKIGDFNMGLLVKVGGVAGASSAQSAFQANLGYEKGPLGIQLTHQAFKDAFSISNPNGTTQPMGTLAASAYDTKASMLSARYALGSVTFKAGYEYIQYTNPSHPIEDARISSLFGLVVSAMNTVPYALGAKNVKAYWLGGGYDVTPNFNISTGYYHVAQNDFSGGAVVPSAKSAGSTKYYSLLLDYRFTKKFDTYVGYMGNKVSDGMAFGFLYDNNAIIGVGLRYSF